MDSCCCSLNKYIIWAANFAVFALACASLGVGIYALVDGEGLSDFLDQLEIDEDLNIIYLGSILIIVVSSFVLLITFLGCCGALKVRNDLLNRKSVVFSQPYHCWHLTTILLIFRRADACLEPTSSA